jgi:hypothetical protein
MYLSVGNIAWTTEEVEDWFCDFGSYGCFLELAAVEDSYGLDEGVVPDLVALSLLELR